jgi:hypothetical protein
MPYKKFTTYSGGEKKYAIQNLRTGKITRYSSPEDRDEGIRIREAFAHGFNPTKKFTTVKKHLRKGRGVKNHRRRL